MAENELKGLLVVGRPIPLPQPEQCLALSHGVAAVDEVVVAAVGVAGCQRTRWFRPRTISTAIRQVIPRKVSPRMKRLGI